MGRGISWSNEELAYFARKWLYATWLYDTTVPIFVINQSAWRFAANIYKKINQSVDQEDVRMSFSEVYSGQMEQRSARYSKI